MESLGGLAVIQQVGGAFLALVLLGIYVSRQLRRDEQDERAAQVAAQSAAEAQTDATMIQLLREVREDRADLRLQMRDAEERHRVEIRTVRMDLESTRERVAVLEQRHRDHLALLQVHAAWDAAAIDLNRRMAARLAALGIDVTELADYAVGPAPALYPPTAPLPRYHDERDRLDERHDRLDGPADLPTEPIPAPPPTTEFPQPGTPTTFLH